MKAAVDEVLLGRAVNTVAREQLPESCMDRTTLKHYVQKCWIDPNTICKPKFVTNQELWLSFC